MNHLIPDFEEILQPMLYVRSDDEPLRILDKLYPFTIITSENEYQFDELMPYFSVRGFQYVMPYLFEFFLSKQTSLSGNLFASFENYLRRSENSVVGSNRLIEFLEGGSEQEVEWFYEKLNAVKILLDQQKIESPEINDFVLRRK